jgi:hypothetical protein
MHKWFVWREMNSCDRLWVRWSKIGPPCWVSCPRRLGWLRAITPVEFEVSGFGISSLWAWVGFAGFGGGGT